MVDWLLKPPQILRNVTTTKKLKWNLHYNNPKDSWHQRPGATHHMTSPNILCPCLDRQESSLINSGASIDLTLNQIRILGIWLTSWAWCHSPSSCWGDHCHWWLSLPIRECSWSARVFAWLVCVKWPEHYIVMRQSMLFASGTIFCGHKLYLWVWGHGSLPENGRIPPPVGGRASPPSEGLKVPQGLVHKWWEGGTWDRQVVWWGISSTAGNCAGPLGWKRLSIYKLRSWTVGSDQKSKIAATSGWIKFPR